MAGFSRILLCITMFVILALPCSALSIRCLSIASNGDVTVTWNPSGTSSASYRSWHVYHSIAAAGPYSLVDSNNIYTDTSEIHIGANAGLNPAWYVIIYKSNNGSADILSDTVRTIGLNLINPNSGYANLSWNPIHVPPLASSSIYYQIYREYPAGVITLIDSINVLTAPVPMVYNDLISICNDTIKYHIELIDQSGCISNSIVKADKFQDFHPPDLVEIDSVSIDPVTGNVVIGWLQSPDADANRYVVHIINGANANSIDTVYGRSITAYASTINGSAMSQAFVLLVMDSCDNKPNLSQIHSTIFTTAQFNRCEKSIQLDWSPYDAWGTPVNYEILVSVNGAGETSAGFTTATSFIDTNIVSGNIYCYRIRAHETVSLRTSSSNRVCITPAFPPPPDYSYIRKVSVTGSNSVLIEAFVDASSSVSGYELQRSLSPLGPFITIASVTVTGVSDISFTDDVSTSEGPWYYQIITLDSCQLPVYTSQISQTILLTATAEDNYLNAVNWTNYSDWAGNVNSYNLYRSINGVMDPVPFMTFSSSDFNFIDSVLEDFFSGGEFCYVIEAIEGSGNPYFFLDSVRSNEVCVEQSPLIFIPNAFHPGGGLNEIFYPSNSFVNPEGYSLDIFDRWGERIFHSEDPHQGWDGSSHKKFAQEGIYIYLLKAKDPDGNEIFKKGSVTLIR
jgi:gliding motility-associated-like protein